MGPYRDGWKGDRPGVRLKERTGEEPEDHKRYVVRVEINEKTADIQA